MHALSDVRREFVPSAAVRWHEYADLFPWIEGKAFDEFRESVRAEGVVEPIVFLDHAILDGRNRYMAARSLGIDYPRVDYLGDDPLGFVIAKNLPRRHLDTSQRAMLAAKLAKLPRGRPAADSVAMRADDAAAMMNVAPRTVDFAIRVERQGAPELKAAVEAGEIRVSLAAEIASLPVDQQVEILKQADTKAIRQVVKQDRAKKQVEKKARRKEREETLAAKQTALPDRKFGLIYADPAWRFVTQSEETGMDRAADNHYPTMKLEEIMALDVGAIAEKDCILFLWATVPMLAEAFCVADAWGFCWLDRNQNGHLVPVKDHARYVSSWAWLKEKIITGYWNRGKHEVLLVFTRGNPVAPAMGDQLPSWVEGEAVIAAQGEHSAKPELFLDWIDALWPNTPKIELNRRGTARPGWTAWGNEAEA